MSKKYVLRINKANPQKNVFFREFFAQGKTEITNIGKLNDKAMMENSESCPPPKLPPLLLNIVISNKPENIDSAKRKINLTPGGYFSSFILYYSASDSFYFLNLIRVFLRQITLIILLI